MKEFIDKLIERLEEIHGIYKKKYRLGIGNLQVLDGCQRGLEDAIEIVNELAEEYKGGWIPCSERLPEAGKAVLTCDRGGWISVNVNTTYAGRRNDFECGYYVAWMPLPEPYRLK